MDFCKNYFKKINLYEIMHVIDTSKLPPQKTEVSI